MFKKWFTRTSPFLILSVPCAFLILFHLVFGNDGQFEWKRQFIFRLFYALLFLVVLDVLLKNLLNKNYWLWITEIVLCLGFVYYWIVS